jgi:dihydroorotase-like cyclic amidohydrolase
LSREAQVEAKSVIDAKGKHIFPGAIDPHVHWGLFRHPSPWKAPGESRAAVIGGTTTAIILLPATISTIKRDNQGPGCTA